MIHKVIRCDICATQKRQTNHWFVAYEESGELRVSGWNSTRVWDPQTKHLCGEACALKLVSHFLMGLLNVAAPSPGALVKPTNSEPAICLPVGDPWQPA